MTQGTEMLKAIMYGRVENGKAPKKNKVNQGVRSYCQKGLPRQAFGAEGEGNHKVFWTP